MLKLEYDNTVNQVVEVRYKSGSEASVILWCREGDKWSGKLECDALVGVNGMGKTREGDGKTPVGDFGITTAFGIKPNPGTSLPYIEVTDDLWCCGDEVAYNRMISIKEHPHKCSGEHIIEYQPHYNYAFFLDYNKEGAPGLGSAIFFHCFGTKPYTGGCVAVSEDDMKKILAALEPGARVVIEDNEGK